MKLSQDPAFDREDIEQEMAVRRTLGILHSHCHVARRNFVTDIGRRRTRFEKVRHACPSSFAAPPDPFLVCEQADLIRAVEAEAAKLPQGRTLVDAICRGDSYEKIGRDNGWSKGWTAKLVARLRERSKSLIV
jgi:hypothetical protein